MDIFTNRSMSKTTRTVLLLQLSILDTVSSDLLIFYF